MRWQLLWLSSATSRIGATWRWGRTKPHVFSWLVWAVLTTVACAGQITEGGGPGAWVTGFTALVSYGIFFFALFRGEKNITVTDWLCLLGAAGSMVAWWATHGPLLAVILITIIDALGFAPTFRKSFYSPDEETALTYALSALKFILAIIALRNFTVVTWLYPASLVVMNAGFVGMVMLRRRQLQGHSP